MRRGRSSPAKSQVTGLCLQASRRAAFPLPQRALLAPRRCHVQGGTKRERASGLVSRLRQLRRPCQARVAGRPVWDQPALPAPSGRGPRCPVARILRGARARPCDPQAFVAEASCRWVNGAEEIGEGRQKWSLKEGVSTGQPDKGQNTHGRRGTDGTGKGKQLGLECGGGARLHLFPVKQAGQARAPSPGLQPGLQRVRCRQSLRRHRSLRALPQSGAEPCSPRALCVPYPLRLGGWWVGG